MSSLLCTGYCVLLILYIQECETTKEKLIDTESRLEGAVKVCLSMCPQPVLLGMVTGVRYPRTICMYGTFRLPYQLAIFRPVYGR